MMNKRIYCKSVITQALPWPLPRSNDLPVLVTGCCLKRGACSSSGLLQAWHAALGLKIDDPKKSWQQCNNRTRTTPFMFLKSKLFFSSCKEQHQRIKRTTAAEQSELNFWSPEQQNQALSFWNLCLLYPSRKRSPLSPEALLSEPTQHQSLSSAQVNISLNHLR